MADPAQPTDTQQQHVAQARAYLLANRSQYTEQAIRDHLRASGYSDAEVEAAFLGLPDPSRKLALGSPGLALGVGLGLAALNFVLFPFVLVMSAYSNEASNLIPSVVIIPLVILLIEGGLIWLTTQNRAWTQAVLLALLLPVGLHTLFFGICTAVLSG